jgi:hypothetical protein
MLVEDEKEQEEDSVCGMFWRSDARISYWQIRWSATCLFMFLDRHQSLKTLKTTKVLKPLISSDVEGPWGQDLTGDTPRVRDSPK